MKLPFVIAICIVGLDSSWATSTVDPVAYSEDGVSLATESDRSDDPHSSKDPFDFTVAFLQDDYDTETTNDFNTTTTVTEDSTTTDLSNTTTTITTTTTSTSKTTTTRKPRPPITTPPPTDDDDVPMTIIYSTIGVVSGIILLCLCIGCIVYFCRCRGKRKKTTETNTEPSTEPLIRHRPHADSPPLSEVTGDHINPNDIKYKGRLEIPEVIIPIGRQDDDELDENEANHSGKFTLNKNMIEAVEVGSEVEKVGDKSPLRRRNPKAIRD
ncbi:unnamed protein product [Bursaphelenchus okinawaensis]|uniref:Uncharacterized protein n=1 Tax=Bursaphelenchus okinawaensis TaxID=465554 RepID=A0A811LQY4_9BILA|nr:unnamed protein product [Bursaphelenchus okinawaensis]CAG9127263.1 unnamed protein product [Bursaphelenchus okinawaensis]